MTDSENAITTLHEQVIKAIELCYTVGYNCNECPYKNQYNCNDWLMRDALALLREQEPRVMTREELKQFEGSPCWFESHGTYIGGDLIEPKEGFWIIPYMFTCYQTMYYVFPLLNANERGDIHYSELVLSAYNKAWRCWTAKPTDEQRQAVKWEVEA